MVSVDYTAVMKFIIWVLIGVGIIVLSILTRIIYNKLLKKAPGAAVRLGKAWGKTTNRYAALRSLNTFFYLLGMGVTLAGIILAIVTIINGPTVQLSRPVHVVNDTLEADEVLKLVNFEREIAGRKALVTDRRITGIAQARLDDMVKNQYYAHLNPDGKYFYDLFADYKIATDYSCENLDIQFTTDERRYVHDWMESTKGHKECLLNKDITNAGYAVGLFSSGAGHNIYLVVGIHTTSISVAEPPETKTNRRLLP